MFSVFKRRYIGIQVTGVGLRVCFQTFSYKKLAKFDVGLVRPRAAHGVEGLAYSMGGEQLICPGQRPV